MKIIESVKSKTIKGTNTEVFTKDGAAFIKTPAGDFKITSKGMRRQGQLDVSFNANGKRMKGELTENAEIAKEMIEATFKDAKLVEFESIDEFFELSKNEEFGFSFEINGTSFAYKYGK